MSFLRRFTDNNTFTLTDAATIAVDMSNGPHFQVTLGGNRTLGNPTNFSATKETWIAVAQDGTGGRTLAFGTDWIASDPSTTINSTINSVSVIYAIARDFGSGIKWYYSVIHGAETDPLASPKLIPIVSYGGSNITLQLSDAHSLLRMNSSSPRTTTIPPNSSVAFSIGTVINQFHEGTGSVSYVAGSGVTILSYNSSLTSAGQNSMQTMIKIDTNTWILTGSLA